MPVLASQDPGVWEIMPVLASQDPKVGEGYPGI